ncbi:MAG: hypothetical protein GEV28_34760 [Actinophytocola sp.]|uniref:hypothetical protein n=1 Tax=Actinophytocola sp. TaxID=1872138 RepID=UPI00132819BA|nr:hypothetical protein [Actinophytocola sp.]MPZ85273.1 hypothetical protein [Actinophytocola sp.]
MGNHTVDIVMSIDGADASPQALDRLTTLLIGDLRTARVGRVDRRSAPAGQGSKSGLVPLVGELTVSGMASAAVWLLYKTLTAFLDRSKARSITVKVGAAEIEVTAASKDEIAKVMALAVQHVLDGGSPQPHTPAKPHDE